MSDPLAPLRPALAERYALERELGRGGMATVYLARDLKHARRVALKVDLYLSGHSVLVPAVRGRPLHRFVAEVLLCLVPVAVAGLVFRRDRPPVP